MVGKGNSKQRPISIHYFRHLHLKLCHATLVRLRLSFQGYFNVQMATEVNMLPPSPSHSLLLILACIFLHSQATPMPGGPLGEWEQELLRTNKNTTRYIHQCLNRCMPWSDPQLGCTNKCCGTTEAEQSQTSYYCLKTHFKEH